MEKNNDFDKHKFQLSFNALSWNDQMLLEELRYLVKCGFSPEEIVQRMGLRWQPCTIAVVRLLEAYFR